MGMEIKITNMKRGFLTNHNHFPRHYFAPAQAQLCGLLPLFLPALSPPVGVTPIPLGYSLPAFLVPKSFLCSCGAVNIPEPQKMTIFVNYL